MRRSKKDSQKRHAKRRAEERYGLSLKDEDYRAMVAMIEEGNEKITQLDKQSLRITLFAVLWDERWLPIIYDNKRKTVVTILPKIALQPYEKKLEAVAKELGINAS